MLFLMLTFYSSSCATDDGNIIAQLPPDPADVFDVTDGIERSVAENLS